MLKKIMLFLSDVLTVKKTTNYTLKKLKEYTLIVILISCVLIDVDYILEKLGL